MIPRYSMMFACFLFLGGLLSGFRAGAEPLYPLLSPAAADSVRTLLRHSKPDTNRVRWFLQLGEDFLSKGRVPGDLDSADRYSGAALALSQTLHFAAGRIRSRYLLGVVSSQRGNYGRGVSLIKKSLALSQDTGNQPLEAEGWYYLGEAYERSPEDLPQKIRCYAQARKCYRQLGNQEKEAYLLKCIADMHSLQGQYDQAYSELLEVLVLYRATGYRKLHYTYDLLLLVNQRIGNYQEAVRYGLACIESAQATKDTADISVFYRRLGALHEELNRWEDGMPFLRKALANYLQEENQAMVVNTAQRIVSNLLAQGKAREAFHFFTKLVKKYPPINRDSHLEAATALAECHLALKQYPLAEKYFLQMLDIEKTIRENGRRKIENYVRIGKFYLVTRQYGKARHYLDTALHLNTLKGSMKYAVDIHVLLFSVDSAQGRYREAIAHHQRYKSLNDSIFNDKQSMQIASLQIQYKTKEKEQNIALLTKQNEIQQVHLKQKDFQQQVIVAGASMLLLLLGLGYNRYRLKQRSNQQLQAQQQTLQAQQQQINQKNQDLQLLLEEKEWMMKEIHHRVKNNLQLITGLLYSQAAYLKDPAALTAIRESHNRVHAMALIHQRLYQSNNLKTVAMDTYIEEIVSHLVQSFDRRDSVDLQLEVGSLELDLSQAIPLGLIINEAITNALKYAFPGGKAGTIALALQAVAPATQDGPTYQLTIADNGLGMPPEVDLQQSHTLGLSMIQGLSQQIKGSLQITHQAGVQIRLQFNPAKLTKSHVLFA